MISKFWTLSQMRDLAQVIEKYDVPEAVFDVIKSNLEILDDTYGADRSITADGGYVALILPEDNYLYQEELDNLLLEYRLSEEDVEFHDSICTDQTGCSWKCDTYILNEYALIVLYSIEEGV